MGRRRRRRRRRPAAAVVPPRGGQRIVDSHAHLDSCDADPAELVAEAAAAGVERIVTIGVGRESSERAIALAEEHEAVLATVGVHPHDADGFTTADESWLVELGAHPRVVAIGETGLDYHREHSTPVAQRRAFVAQIGIARELDLPLVIHTRDAADDTLAVLEAEAEGLRVLMHCFSIPERVVEVAERGYWTSFAGQVTYPRANDLHTAAARVPLERLLVETDSPYLAPVPRRGRPNRPANVAHTLRFIAGLRGLPPAELDAVTSANAARLFGW